MKLELYSIPQCPEAAKIRDFLIKNNLPFKEIITATPIKDSNIPKNPFFQEKEHSILKVTKNHCIQACGEFNEHFLNQEIIEHIKKYNLKIYS